MKSSQEISALLLTLAGRVESDESTIENEFGPSLPSYLAGTKAMVALARETAAELAAAPLPSVGLVDYRALLVRYIQHVRECEGTDYTDIRASPSHSLTDAEWAELQRLSGEEPR
jgi:hypothetical protein